MVRMTQANELEKKLYEEYQRLKLGNDTETSEMKYYAAPERKNEKWDLPLPYSSKIGRTVAAGLGLLLAAGVCVTGTKTVYDFIQNRDNTPTIEVVATEEIETEVVPSTPAPIPTQIPPTIEPTPTIMDISINNRSSVENWCNARYFAANLAPELDASIKYNILEGSKENVRFRFYESPMIKRLFGDPVSEIHWFGDESYKYEFNTEDGGEFIFVLDNCSTTQPTKIEIETSHGVWSTVKELSTYHAPYDYNYSYR